MLSISEELRKRAGKLAAECLEQESTPPGIDMEEWNRLRYNIAHELLNA